MNSNKKFYRIKFQALRIKLLKNEIDNLNDKIFSLVKKMPIWEKETFHLFISSEEKREVETKKILYYLYSLNKKNHFVCNLDEKQVLTSLQGFAIH